MNNEIEVCTWKNEENCVDCGLQGKLNCRYDVELYQCFRKRHIPFRSYAIVFVGFVSYVTGVWLLFLLYVGVTFLNFIAIETYYLCRHCPFYQKDGRTLQCITLKGLPRFWRATLSPIPRNEQLMMMAVGGFIDLFPLLAGVYGVWWLWSFSADMLLLSTMVVLTILTLVVSGILGKFIENNYCKKCVNLSCFMNKVPENLAREYLKNNPEMLRAWKECGYNEASD